MANVRFVCLSDLHLGEEDSLLTNTAATGEVDVAAPSPCLVLLAECIAEILEHNGSGAPKPTLVLNGDVLELALADMDKAANVFSQFVTLFMPRNGPLFDEIIFLPGNHDHHLWELARETQYLNYLRRLPSIADSKEPWHTTKVFMNMRGEDRLGSRLLTLIARRLPHLEERKTEILTAYPNFGVRAANGRAAIFHHGHFIESLYHLMSTARSLVFDSKELPDDVYGLESDNFAWIDFFWSSLGRSGEPGQAVEAIYEATNDSKSLQAVTDALAANVAKRYRLPLLRFDWLEKKVLQGLLRRLIAERLAAKQERQTPLGEGAEIPLSDAAGVGLDQYLKVFLPRQMAAERERLPDALSFVFGHTHKPFVQARKCEAYGQPVSILNTGGWVVDTLKPDLPHGAAAVLLDEDLNAVSVRLFNEGRYRAWVEEPLAQGQAHGALHAHVSGIVNASLDPWRSLGATIEKEVPRRAALLEARIRRLREKIEARPK